MAKIQVEASEARHIEDRIRERFENDAAGADLVRRKVRELLGMQAPTEATGHYEYQVLVHGAGGMIGRIILRGIFIRTVYSMKENYPNSRAYRITGGRLV